MQHLLSSLHIPAGPKELKELQPTVHFQLLLPSHDGKFFNLLGPGKLLSQANIDIFLDSLSLDHSS